MRIPDYRFTAPIKAQGYWSSKKRRVDKIREDEFSKELFEDLSERVNKIRGDEFSKELEESLYKKESETKKKNALPT